MNKTDRKKLEEMLASGVAELSEQELKIMIDAELSKDEAEIDTDYIDMCFGLLDLIGKEETKPRIRLRSSARAIIIAAAIVMLFVSSITVAAQVFNVNPIEKIVQSVDNEIKETTTVKETENKTTRYKNKTTAATVKSYKIPDFLSETIYRSDVEENKAWNSHFTIEFVGEYSVDIPEGVVFAQSIDAGKAVKKGTRLVLTYSLGRHLVEMPDVVDMTVEEARSILNETGFVVEIFEPENSNGIVASTSEAAGDMLEYQSVVILYLGNEISTTENETETTDMTDNSTFEALNAE